MSDIDSPSILLPFQARDQPVPPNIVALATAETFTQSSLTRRGWLSFSIPALKGLAKFSRRSATKKLLNSTERLFGQSLSSLQLLATAHICGGDNEEQQDCCDENHVQHCPGPHQLKLYPRSSRKK
jgi:hypothetical protein